MAATVQTWLVERTYSDDEQNIIILVYATPDGRQYHRKERSLTSFDSDIRDTYAGLDVPEDELGDITDEETRAEYAATAKQMAEKHDPNDVV